jgi:hypothetical protein
MISGTRTRYETTATVDPRAKERRDKFRVQDHDRVVAR